jgi:hypothetical protein
MNFKNIVEKLFIGLGLIVASQMVSAQNFTCPTVEELKNFSGFFFEYPLSLNLQTQVEDSWLVAQINVKDIDHLRNTAVDSLIMSPVKPQQGEYPSDASIKMIDNLQTYIMKDGDQDVPICENQDGIGQICACAYWAPIDGSLAFYVHVEQNGKKPVNPMENINIAAKAMQTIQRNRG